MTWARACAAPRLAPGWSTNRDPVHRGPGDARSRAPAVGASPRPSDPSRPMTSAGTWRNTPSGPAPSSATAPGGWRRASSAGARTSTAPPCPRSTPRTSCSPGRASPTGPAGAARSWWMQRPRSRPGPRRTRSAAPARPPPPCWGSPGNCCTTAPASSSRAANRCGCAGACPTPGCWACRSLSPRSAVCWSAPDPRTTPAATSTTG